VGEVYSCLSLENDGELRFDVEIFFIFRESFRVFLCRGLSG
jgi:hypothetical protein